MTRPQPTKTSFKGLENFSMSDLADACQLRMGGGNRATIRSPVPDSKGLSYLREATNFWFSKEVDVLVMAEESVHVVRVR